MQTGTSGCEIDRSIHALRRRPLPGNRARSARGGRVRSLLVGAGGAWRAGPPCRPEEARRARAVGHRGTTDGGNKVAEARKTSVRVELGLPWIRWIEVGSATGQAGWDLCGTRQTRIHPWDSVTMMSMVASQETSDQSTSLVTQLTPTRALPLHQQHYNPPNTNIYIYILYIYCK